MFTFVLIFAIAGAVANAATVVDIPGFSHLGKEDIDDADGNQLTVAYFLSTNPVPFNDAVNQCRNLGGILAAPLNPVLNNDLRVFLQSQNYISTAWIGAKAYGSLWTWFETNSPVMWNNFKSGCMWNDYCAYTDGSIGASFGWCSASCTGSRRFICQF